MTTSDCKTECKWASWYNEQDTTSNGSRVEIVIFYVSMFFTLVFGLITGFACKFDLRFLLFLIPLAIWMFLRCSRKDMKATAYLIAGLFGAFGGAITAILLKVLGGY
jgi:hypothetical protein